MFARLRKDPFSVAMLRVLGLLLAVVAFGFIAAAIDLWGITMSTTAGVLVGGVAVVAISLSFRNVQLKQRENSDDAGNDRGVTPGDTH